MTPPVSGGVPEQGLRDGLLELRNRLDDALREARSTFARVIIAEVQEKLTNLTALERPRPALPARADLERLTRDELISVCDLYERRLAHSEELRAGLAAALHEAHIAAGLKIGDRVPWAALPAEHAPPASRPSSRLRNVIAGLEIFQRQGSKSVNAEHDVIYAGPSTKDALNETDRDALRVAGWFWDEEVESWAIFV